MPKTALQRASRTHRTTRLMLTAVAALTFATTGLRADDADFDPSSGYRISRYRTPVPNSVAGGERISAADVEGLLKSKNAILLDVMPSDGIGPDPATGTWLSFKPRQNIPGSHWLPDVGKGYLSPDMDSYFIANLDRLTGSDKTRAIIVYCQADCWMSWNAVKRAAGYGYSQLYWFAEGTDGWRDWDGKFESATPVPLAPPKSN